MRHFKKGLPLRSSLLFALFVLFHKLYSGKTAARNVYSCAGFAISTDPACNRLFLEVLPEGLRGISKQNIDS